MYRRKNRTTDSLSNANFGSLQKRQDVPVREKSFLIANNRSLYLTSPPSEHFTSYYQYLL